MSKIALSGNALGTGTFTIASPNSNTDRTLNLPDAGGDMVLTDATQTLTNKSIDSAQLTGNVAAARITNALNASGSAPIHACRAWVNFDGTTSPGTIRASGNVSSVTRSGTGDFTVNFTTALPDANYAVNVTGPNASLGSATSVSYGIHGTGFGTGTLPTTSGVRVTAHRNNNTGDGINSNIICVSIHR